MQWRREGGGLVGTGAGATGREEGREGGREGKFSFTGAQGFPRGGHRSNGRQCYGGPLHLIASFSMHLGHWRDT